MALLLDLLGFLLFLVIGPFLVLGSIAGRIAQDIERTFNIPMLGLAMTCAGMCLITFDHMAPVPSDDPFQSVVVVLLDKIGQAHLVGVPLPFVFAILAGLFFAGSVLLRARDPN